MKRTSSRAAGALILALAVLALTGTALADTGNGNSANAPGQATAPGQQVDATPAQPAPASQSSSQAPGQVKKAATPSPRSSSTSSPGRAKQQAKASSSTAGVKPSNTTNATKPTSCSTGTSGGSVTCTGNGPKPDSSKQYGNGKTAAQIAAANGAPAGTKISGPGNSQPHKVTACGKPNNKSGGVDVHAVKSYDASACQTAAPAACTVNCSTPPTAPCGYSVTSETTITGVMHMNGKGQPVRVMTNPKSAHFQPKHGDTVATTQTTYSLVANGDSCVQSLQNLSSSSSPIATSSSSNTSSSSSNTSSSSSSTSNQSGAVLSAGATPVGSSTSAAPAQGGVLGATAALNAPKPQRGGVLGAVTNIAGSTLPFTGFPLWIAVLLAAVLIAAGLVLRGRGTTSRV